MKPFLPRLFVPLLLLLAAGTAWSAPADQPGFFAFGGIGFAGATSPGELKFREILASDDPEAGFKTWAEDGGNVGKAYALVACYYLNDRRYEEIKTVFADNHLQVPRMRGCIVDSLNQEQVFESIENGDYDTYVKPLLPPDVRAECFPNPAAEAFSLGPVGERIERSPTELAFEEIFASDTPRYKLSEWLGGSPVEQAYALVGYYYLAPKSYEFAKKNRKDDTTVFMTYSDCSSRAVNYGDFIRQIEAGMYDEAMAPLLKTYALHPAFAPEAGKPIPEAFAIGGVYFSGKTSTGELILRDILASSDRDVLLEDWYTNGTPVQRAYAILAFHYLAPDRYQLAKQDLADDTTPFTWQEGCTPETITYARLFELIGAGRFDSIKPYLDPAYESNRPDYDFCLGGITTLRLTPGEMKFREIVASDDPIQGLEDWYANGTAAERAYCLLGFYYIAPERYAELKPTLSEKYDYFSRFKGVEEFGDNCLSFTELIERGTLDPYVTPILGMPPAGKGRIFPRGDKEALFGTQDVPDATHPSTGNTTDTCPAPTLDASAEALAPKNSL